MENDYSPTIIGIAGTDKGFVKQTCIACNRIFLSPVTFVIVNGEPCAKCTVAAAMFTLTGNCMYCDPNYLLEPGLGQEYAYETTPALIPSVN